MRHFVILLLSVMVNTAFAQDYDTYYYTKKVPVLALKNHVGVNLTLDDFQLLGAEAAIVEYQVGSGQVIKRVVAHKLKVLVKDVGQPKFFKVNGVLVGWNQSTGSRVSFLGDDQFGDDIVDIYVEDDSRELQVTFLSDFQAVTPNINNPEGYVADQFSMDITLGAPVN